MRATGRLAVCATRMRHVRSEPRLVISDTSAIDSDLFSFNTSNFS